MNITTYNFESLVEEARKELSQMIDQQDALDPDLKMKVSTLFDGFIHLYDMRSNWGYDNSFNLVVNNVPDDLYNEFQLIAKKTKIPLHRLLGITMNEVIESDNLEITAAVLKDYYKTRAKYKINHHTFLRISKQDLDEVDHPVSFNHIGTLEISEDIEESLFLAKIDSINHCNEVLFPSRYSKLAVLMKTRFCNDISFSNFSGTNP